ncbi:AraC family transcriptional regulator [Kineococcus sp. SYSU DK003]|uniref:AraC family transcriptional regulator n=1 Tax=Kineococcus sp. SYSU DK003 TaxID=3383124 RepID=UPI003D7CCE58
MTQTPVHPPWAVADPVGEALHVLRMTGTFYCRSELSQPWGFALPPMPGCLWFHVVTTGRAVLVTAHETVELGPGDLVLVPRGEGHTLAGSPGAATPSILTLEHATSQANYGVLRTGGGGEATTMVCGAVRFDSPAARTLIDLLPALVQVPAAPASRLGDVLRLIALEVEEFRPGGEAVLTRLADVLVVQALRNWLETDPGARAGWLGALSDPLVGPALALVHRDPARNWTVASLASAVSSSRSAFAARFTAVVGEPVMQYVTRWRMHLALDRMRAEDVTVAGLARDLGYRSEAAFSRAFTRVVGQPPGTARRGTSR